MLTDRFSVNNRRSDKLKNFYKRFDTLSVKA